MQNKVPKKSLRILGQNIHRLRNVVGLSQDKLAVKADMTKRYVQLLEAGQKCPSLATLQRLQNAMSCNYEDLLAGF